MTRTALITGASRGIGAAVAKAYAKAGYHTILVARTLGGLEEVDDAIRGAGGTASLVQLDIKDGAKIDQLGQTLAGRFGRLDALVLNAAVLGDLSPIAHADPKQWDEIIATNLTANFRLLRSMHPLLRAAPKALVQVVTSGVTKGASPFWGAYAVSKAGLEMLANTYAAENRQTTIRVEIIDPGVVRTRMRASAFPGEKPESLPAPEEITDKFVKEAAYS